MNSETMTPETKTSETMPIETIYVDVPVWSDKVRLAVDLLGDPAGEPVMVLHGFTGCAAAMEPLTHRLVAAGFQVVAPDLVGHGRSDVPENDDPYSVGGMAEAALNLATELGWDDFHLVGYSMGGRVALAVAVGKPERLRSLCLIGASAGIADADERTARCKSDSELADQVVDNFEGVIDSWMANPMFSGETFLGDEHLKRSRALRLANNPKGLAQSLRAAGTGSMTPLHDKLSRLEMPVLLLAGSYDTKFVKIAGDLQQDLPNATTEVVPRAGHAVHIEAPDETAQAITDLVTRVLRKSRRLKERMGRYKLKLREPLATRAGTFEYREGLILTISSDGLTGWGEVPIELGMPCEDIVRIANEHPDASNWDDHSAQDEGIPLYEHWSSHVGYPKVTCPKKVKVNALVTDAEATTAAQRAAEAVSTGFMVVKLKVGVLDPAVDIERIRQVRAAIGDNVELRIDANRAWNHVTAVDVLRQVEPLGIAHCEEPVAGIEEMAAVMRESGVSIALDESLHRDQPLREVESLIDVDDLRKAHEAGIETVVIKPYTLSDYWSLTPAHNAIRLGMKVVITSIMESAVGVAHALHAAALVDAWAIREGVSTMAHGLATSSLFERDLAELPPIVNGMMEVPTGPGLGITPDESMIEWLD